MDAALTRVRRLARTIPHWDRDELISAGSLALVRACRSWRPSGGASFETWAAFKVSRAMRDALRVWYPRTGWSRTSRGRSFVSVVGLTEAMVYGAAGRRAVPRLVVNEPSHEARAIARLLDRTIATLPDEEQLVLRAHYYEGQTLREIGTRLVRQSRGWSVKRQKGERYHLCATRVAQIQREGLKRLRERLLEAA